MLENLFLEDLLENSTQGSVQVQASLQITARRSIYPSIVILILVIVSHNICKGYEIRVERRR